MDSRFVGLADWKKARVGCRPELEGWKEARVKGMEESQSWNEVNVGGVEASKVGGLELAQI